MHYLPDSNSPKYTSLSFPYIDTKRDPESIQEAEFIDLTKGQQIVLKYLIDYIVENKIFDTIEDKVEVQNRQLAISHFEKDDTAKILDLVDRVRDYLRLVDQNSEFQEYLQNFRTDLLQTIEPKSN